MRTVPENLLPRKDILETLAVPLIVVLVGLGAFGLGRISVVVAADGLCAEEHTT